MLKTAGWDKIQSVNKYLFSGPSLQNNVSNFSTETCGLGASSRVGVAVLKMVSQQYFEIQVPIYQHLTLFRPMYFS